MKRLFYPVITLNLIGRLDTYRDKKDVSQYHGQLCSLLMPRRTLWRGNSPHRVRRNCKLTIRLAISDGRRCNRWGMFGLIGEGVVKFVAEDACLRCRLRISPAVLLAMNLYLVSATIFRVEGLCSKSMAIVVMRRLIRTKSYLLALLLTQPHPSTSLPIYDWISPSASVLPKSTTC